MLRGKLIVFEGLDRAGKSTQCEMLVQGLKKDGCRVRHVRFPDRTTPIGKMINAYLTNQSEQEDHVIHLLFSANRWELADSIQQDIASGTTVVIDRYYYSGCVYSAAKDSPTLDLQWARHPEVGLPRPDVCVFLDISTEDAAKRGGFGEEKYETQKMQVRVRELFDAFLESPDKDDFVRIDAGGEVELVQGDVRRAIEKVMREVDERKMPLRFVEPW
ncbi:thymidylate kinase [Delitschia confertaspora ATCC 74209]|uniref:Thymidylate kinase n=1 Tax=Delitschia confertaspora ATCC 74209 TaxID=1513339 RepID=A0A9P4MZT7_9PLEO|nr:thymidylate kinase [Delitschia confertaspora ATCC 74209]